MNIEDFANLSYDQLVSDVADQVVKIQDAIAKSNKSFLGTVVSITKEQSSTRGVVVLHTGTDRSFDGVPAGCETVRTDRTDDPDGLMMARKVRALKGHKVLVYVELESDKNGQRRYRVLRHIVDKGIDNDMES
jgi:hypothetical protein